MHHALMVPTPTGEQQRPALLLRAEGQGPAGAAAGGVAGGMSGAGTATIIHNARIQLFATLLNTMAGSCFAIGVLTDRRGLLLQRSARGLASRLDRPWYCVLARRLSDATSGGTDGPRRPAATTMSDIELLAFVIMPIVVVGLGWLMAWLGRRYIP